MAEKPSFSNKFNFVVSFILSDCESPATLYVETAWPPAVHASQSLLMFDVGDALRSAFRPKGDRRARHGRKTGKKRGKRRGGIPEPTDMLLNPVKETFGWDTRKLSQGTKFLWTIDTIGQKWLGRAFMVSLLNDFLYEWAVLLAADPSTDCGHPRVRAEDPNIVALKANYGVLTLDHVIFAKNGASYGGGVGFCPAPNKFITVGCNAFNIGGGPFEHDPTPCQIGIEYGGPDGTKRVWSDEKVIAFDTNEELVATVFLGPHDSPGFKVIHRNPDNFVSFNDIVLFATAT